MVLNHFLPLKECFHEIIMLFISWHTKYLNNCKWDFQTMFDFICCSSFYFRSVWHIEIRSKKQVDPANFFEHEVYFLCKIIQMNFKYWCLRYFILLFLFPLINCSQMKAWKWKNTVKLCLKFCRSVESSASVRSNSAWILKCCLKTKKFKGRI